jgi:hypothetical protein
MWKPIEPRLVVAGLASALLLAACSGAASPSPSVPPASPGASVTPGPSTSPSGAPASSPTAVTGALDHPTGATDLVLRFEEGGGFVMPTFAMIQVPYFSLYGDGTVIYRAASEPFPETKAGDPMRFPPLRVATMTEAQVQALLVDALGPAGLGVARPTYQNMQVADAPTAVFTLNADGREKRVSVYALGIAVDDPGNPNPDAAILTAMAGFAERLRNFDQEVAKGSATDAGLYEPARYRASLLEGGPGAEGAPIAWPWPAFGPEDFTVADPASGFGLPSKVLGEAEMAQLGIEDVEGGVSGVSVSGPDGTVYGLGVRPLLPDEAR